MEVTVKLTNEEIENLTESILNGACAYWAEVISADSNLNGGLRGVRFKAHDDGKRHEMTVDKLHKGVALAILNCQSVGSQLHNGIDSCDRNAVDCIVQYALFGKLVYG